jgi:zinc protease
MNIFNTCLIALLISLSQTGVANTFKTEKWHTTSGAQVIFYPAMEVPMLDISLAFAAGSAYDGQHFGLSALTSRMLSQGNAGKDATAIAEALADTGAQFGSETTRDMTVFNLRTLVNKEALTQSIKTLTQIINYPDFPKEVLEHEKTQLLMAIEQSQESPQEVADRHFFKALYQQHPYAHPVNGTKKTLNAIKRSQLIEFYRRYYVGKNATLVLVGSINSQTAHELAEELTHKLPKGAPAKSVTHAEQLTKPIQMNTRFPSSQTMIRLGQIGIDHHNPRYFPLMVGNYILGGGSLVSRLATEIREKRGLTYGVDSEFAPMPGEGPFLISFSTRNEQAKNALGITQQVLQNYLKDGPSDQELEAAKQFLTGSFPLSLASNRSIANLLLRMEFYHLPDNYLDTYITHVNTVTKNDIKEAFNQQIDPNKLLLVTVGA